MTKNNIKCFNCGKEFYKKPNRIEKDKIHTCCQKCYGEYIHKLKVKEIENKFNKDIKELLNQLYWKEMLSLRKISKIIGLTPKKVSEWIKENNIELRYGSEAVKTQWINNDDRRKQTKEIANKYLNNKKTKDKLIKTLRTKESREKASISKMGIKNPMYGKFREQSSRWNPSLTDEERENKRKTFEDEQWRKGIYEKYNYTCYICKDDKGGNLNAHHLNSHDIHISERFDLNNGICLCESCHTEFHKAYGYGKNTKEQFREWEKKFNK